MNSHIKYIEHQPEVLSVWTDKHLSKQEITILAKWLTDEGYVQSEFTHLKVYFNESPSEVIRTKRKIRSRRNNAYFHLSKKLASILLFSWIMSLAICCYILFSIS